MRIHFTRRAAAVAAAIALLVPAAQAQTAKPRVGLVMKSLANEFFKNMTEGALAYEKKRGDFELKAVGMQSETDFDAQTAAVENFITQKYDVIVIAPADSRAMVAPIARALKAGITVVNFDVALDPAALKKAGLDLAFVGPTTAAVPSSRAMNWPRHWGRAPRSSSSKATPAPTTRCSASWVLKTLQRLASSTSSLRRRRTGKPKKPTRCSPTSLPPTPTSRA
jgi:hypothetical protein